MFRKGIAPALIAALAIALLAGCASTTTTTVNAQAPQAPQAKPKSKNASVTGVIALHGKPQVVDPVAGGSPGGSGSGGSADSGPGGGSGGSDGGGYTPAADGSGNAGGTGNGSSGSGPHKGPGWVSVTPSPGQKLAKPDSNADIEKELSASGINPNPDRATLTKQGLAIPPANAPPQVVAAIQAGNEIAHLPYVWGGGHGKYVDTGYDCSGSLSFMFGAAGILNTTMTSGDLMSWGQPGDGKWITVYANGDHTFAYIAGLRFDTVALAETGTRWSNRTADEPDANTMAVRHPVGL